MVLLDRCKALRERIETHESLRLANKEAEGFRERAKVLEEVHRELAAALRKADVLRQKGFEVAKLPDPTAALAAGVAYVAELSEGSVEGGAYSRFKRSVEKVKKEVVSAVEKALETVKR